MERIAAIKKRETECDGSHAVYADVRFKYAFHLAAALWAFVKKADPVRRTL